VRKYQRFDDSLTINHYYIIFAPRYRTRRFAAATFCCDYDISVIFYVSYIFAHRGFGLC